MKHIAIGCAAIIGVAVATLSSPPAGARGGVNASYARAYCAFYKNKIAVAARGYSRRALASHDRSRSKQRGSPEYWRQKYRDCLKEHGY